MSPRGPPPGRSCRNQSFPCRSRSSRSGGPWLLPLPQEPWPLLPFGIEISSVVRDRAHSQCDCVAFIGKHVHINLYSQNSLCTGGIASAVFFVAAETEDRRVLQPYLQKKFVMYGRSSIDHSIVSELAYNLYDEDKVSLCKQEMINKYLQARL